MSSRSACNSSNIRLVSCLFSVLNMEGYPGTVPLEGCGVSHAPVEAGRKEPAGVVKVLDCLVGKARPNQLVDQKLVEVMVLPDMRWHWRVQAAA